jgi:gamma-glutamylcysteine synthetase
MSAKNNTVSEKQTKYVVIRNGLRVSDLEYSNKDEAKVEYDHWKNIITRWPDGSKLEIVEVKGK